jgi:hypothetical protein
MANLVDLDNLSDEQKGKILQVLRQTNQSNSVAPDEDELRSLKSNRVNESQSYEYDADGIELDTGQNFDNEFNNIPSSDGYNMQQKRISGRLNERDRETYRQLTLIHQYGPGFREMVRRIVESRQEINTDDISDQIDPREYF